MIEPIFGRPRIGTERQVVHRIVSRQGMWDFLANGALIDGTKSRDFTNTSDTKALRPGLLMGKVTSGGKYAPSVLGVTNGAYASGTSLTLTAASAAELARRVGTSGTFKLTGPTAASGVARTLTVTYSAVDTGTGVVTITALGANQQEDVRLNPAGTAGNLQLNVSKPDGTRVTTANIAWGATDATYLAAINSALDTATGVVGGIVATAIAATDTDLGFTLTYSGTGYAGLSWPEAEVAVMPTSSTSWFTAPRTTAVAAPFVSGSLVQPTDGSETPVTLIPDGYGILIGADSLDEEWPNVPIGAVIDFAQVLPAISDSGLKTWVKERLSTVAGGKFTFSDQF